MRTASGPAGAGKTSLLNLLSRFYDPTEGRVLLGGVALRELALDELRHEVALVTQRPILFSIPLADSLRTARARTHNARTREDEHDDPMAAVDTETERHLVENLRPALGGRTVLVAT